MIRDSLAPVRAETRPRIHRDFPRRHKASPRVLQEQPGPRRIRSMLDPTVLGPPGPVGPDPVGLDPAGTGPAADLGLAAIGLAAIDLFLAAAGLCRRAGLGFRLTAASDCACLPTAPELFQCRLYRRGLFRAGPAAGARPAPAATDRANDPTP